MLLDLADDGVVSDTIEVGRAGSSAKRVHRPAEEKRRIVEATLLPGVSIARVARERGVNANQVFQWRYEYRNSAGWAAKRPRTELLPVTVVAEPSSAMAPEVAPVATSSGSIRYALSRWRALSRYLEDGQIEMDNSAAERALRVVALGRKNYLFADSDAGGERAAAIYSLLGTAKLNGLDPELYLRRILEQIADHPINRMRRCCLGIWLQPCEATLPQPPKTHSSRHLLDT